MWKNVLLTRVETSSPETFTTPLGLWFRRKLHPILRPLLRLASGCRIHEDKKYDLVKYMQENWKK